MNANAEMILEDYIRDYQCDSETNNYIHKHFTERTEQIKLLFSHRAYIEQNKLGFGDRAFHFMWYLILESLFSRNTNPSLLEIGVYKGQVISLWSLLAKHWKNQPFISAITPLEGNLRPITGIKYKWTYMTSAKFRADVRSGNFYENENYLEVISSLFNHFELSIDEILFHKGLSTDLPILDSLRESQYDLIYIDGDHSKTGVEMDIANFAPKVKSNGFLVMDDASCNLPGGESGEYWKGHQTVADACDLIPEFGFDNVLNVGHNRVYQKK